MGRYYRLAKKITDDMAEEILKEIQELQDVEKAEFVEEKTKIMVLAGEDKYPEVMTKVVNIFSRIGNDCALSFTGFVHEA